jgi:hypothetical protein
MTADFILPHPENTAREEPMKNIKACTNLSRPKFSQKDIFGKDLLDMACRPKTTTAHKM